MVKILVHDIELLVNASLDQRLVQALFSKASMALKQLEKSRDQVLTPVSRNLIFDLIDVRYFKLLELNIIFLFNELS